MIAAVWGKIKGWLAIGGLAVAAVAFAFWRGMRSGRDSAAADRAKDQRKAKERRADVDEEIAGLDATSLDERLKRWMRDGRDR